ncbi:hypothetical protein [Labilibaculum sp.]|uniref:hypothetical protein n=1 Tax=Labilibaculum sp. TaxID=2060723 RepID=UPI003561B7EE
MSIANAVKFMKKTDNDSCFRKALYKLDSAKDFEDFQIRENLEFSAFELEEAFNYLHTQCQFAEEADKLFNVKHLLDLIVPLTDIKL